MKEHKDGFNEEFWSSWRDDNDGLAHWQQKRKIHPYDSIKQYKWPEEKPTETKGYLVNIPGRKNGEKVVMYYSVEWEEWGFRDGNTLITSTQEPNYWWDLPRIVER